MMHGSSMAASSSWQGGCPPIAEHQEWYPPVPQQHVKFRIQDTRLRPTFGTLMSKRVLAVQGPLHPSCVIAVLWTVNASMENLRELQRYSEKLQFEATCVRLWADGIQDQIMDEQEKVQSWIAGVTDEINMRRTPPAWTQRLQSPGSQPPQMSMAQLPARSSQQHHPVPYLPFQ